MKKTVFVFIGIALSIGVIATGSYGLSKQNIEIYTEAVAMQDMVDTIGFTDFRLTDYRVSFFDGNKDYVMTWENGNYRIDERTPVLNTIAATAYPVNDCYEVLVPTVEKMNSLLGIMNGMQSADQLSEGDNMDLQSGYSTCEHISTIWHEAFHAYQLTMFRRNIESIYMNASDENVIAVYADTNLKAVLLFKQQAELLESAVKCDDIDKIRESVLKYKKLEEERKALLSENVSSLEEYYKRIEGTARYIEATVYKIQLPDKFEETHIDSISEYSSGSDKYYKVGMAQCLILDKLNPKWKIGYDFSVSVMDLIYDELEIGNGI